MHTETENLEAKFKGIADGIKGLPVSILDTLVSINFAADYNSARDLALKTHPEIAATFPPPVDIAKGIDTETGEVRAHATYADISVYATQAYLLIHPRAEDERNRRIGENQRRLVAAAAANRRVIRYN